MSAVELDLKSFYRVEGWDGIAWYLRGYAMTRDEDYEWTGIEHEDRDHVIAVMVGDDTEYFIEVEDLTVLDEEEFCHGCGQIGCCW